MASRLGIDEPDFAVGDVYYFVTYADLTMMYPEIETYVFLGKNFSNEDVDDTLYFQPAPDYAIHGSAIDGSERPVFCANRSELSEFQTLSKLMETLNVSAARRLVRP